MPSSKSFQRHLVAARFLDDDQSIDVGVSLCHARAVIHDQIVNFPAGSCCLRLLHSAGEISTSPICLVCTTRYFMERASSEVGLNVSASAYRTPLSDAAAMG